MPKPTRNLVPALFVAAFLLLTAILSAAEWQPIDIPYQKFVLKNGLTLIVHEDHKAPIVAVNVWYHVGSKNEKPGRTGFAHLFEHLMFNGSEHYNDDYFKVLNRIGATTLNGTTNFDRTNYFQNVPTSALDTVLWMESDRMGHMLGAVDQARLDEQRGVVQNEKRQGENQPYGRVYYRIVENIFPAGHPYSWLPIGSMEDLNAASLEDVHEWFKNYYGAANAVIVIAGDIDAETARQKVERFFGAIPAGPPVTAQESWIAPRTENRRQTMQDRVPQSRIYKVWNMPQWGDAQALYLDLVTDILALGKNSRFYKRLVYDEQIATDVNAFVFLQEIAGILVLMADARPGVELAAVEKAMDEELARLLKEGPTPQEMERIKTQRRSEFIRGVERIGGFGGKSDILAMNQVYGGTPDFHKVTQERIHKVTAKDIQDAAQRWLSTGWYALEVHPFPEYATAASDVDRSKLPEPGTPPQASFPKIQRATLSNGLKLILAERHSVPKIDFRLIVDAGYAADQGTKAGTASMTLDMLDEGTKTLNALQISEKLALLGAEMATDSDLDVSSVSISALKEKLDPSLELFSDVILNPSFPQEELERLRKQRLAEIEQEKAQPFQVALRLLPRLLYGDGHAYANPFTGTGTIQTTNEMTRDDLARFHDQWFKPNHSTLIVVGDTTLAEIQPKLEKVLAVWKPGEVPEKKITPVTPPEKPSVYIIDRPQATQSVIFTGQVAPPSSDPNNLAIKTTHMILGGNFIARINMNLREDKHWSYGARTFLIDARGQRPLGVNAPVQTDKTKESVQEIVKELKGIYGEIPITPDELQKGKVAQTLTLPGQWETTDAVVNSIVEIVNFNLPDDYFDKISQGINALTLEDVKKAAESVVLPGKQVWIVIGDRQKIEAGIRELNLGEIRFLNTEGELVQ